MNPQTNDQQPRTDIFVASYVDYKHGRTVIGVVTKNGDSQAFDPCLPRITRQTNKAVADLEAAVDVLKMAKDIPNATIHMQNYYVTDGMTRNLAAWSQNDWRRKDGKPIKNREIWEKVLALGPDNVDWQKVEDGEHSEGVYQAFLLAKEAASKSDRDDQGPPLDGAVVALKPSCPPSAPSAQQAVTSPPEHPRQEEGERWH